MEGDMVGRRSQGDDRREHRLCTARWCRGYSSGAAGSYGGGSPRSRLLPAVGAAERNSGHDGEKRKGDKRTKRKEEQDKAEVWIHRTRERNKAAGGRKTERYDGREHDQQNRGSGTEQWGMDEGTGAAER